ncbi:MAG: glycosyltransferase family 39 protein [Candidatus Curtissbacteria bacterium]|nr:glycosyltransferase family 39 protein [Candidatus Curtissbacteria bacterium]
MISQKSPYFKIFLLIFVLAAILRFWRLDSLTTVSGDQGFDFLAVWNMVQGKNITLLGPKIGPYNEIGNLYLGPAYYYLLIPALMLTGFDPVGAAALTVVLALLTILLVYVIGREYFSPEAALVASAVYALNPLLINQSRASSNPHLIPFFAAVFIYAALKIIVTKSKSFIWPIICGLVLGVAVQLHYLALALASVLVLALLGRRQAKKLLVVGGVFILAISPQILFETRHDFFVTRIFVKQLTAGENIFSFGLLFGHLGQSFKILGDIFIPSLPVILVGVFVAAAVLSLGKERRKIAPQTLFLAGVVIVGFFAASLYAGRIDIHYFATLYVPLAILVGTMFAAFFRKDLLSKSVSVVVLVLILGSYLFDLNLDSQNGYTMPKGWNLPGIRKVSRIIAADAKSGEKFNIAATLDGDTRAMPLRYMTEVYGKRALDVERYPESDSIYLVSRDGREKIKDYSVWEISSFRPFKIDAMWEIQNGISLYKLSHNM